MSGIAIKRITNANVYVDGNSLLGKVEECKLPEIKMIMAEHKALGMQGKMEFPSGVDKMEATFKWNSLYPDVLAKVANPFQAVSVQLRGSLETWAQSGRISQGQVVAYLTGTFSKFPAGGFKQHDNVENENTMSVTYCKVEIEGREIIEFDAMANIYKADGVDLLAEYRMLIGG